MERMSAVSHHRCEHEQWNTLIVHESNRLKSLRGALEEAGWYDNSRSIEKIPSKEQPRQEQFALPVTQTCVRHFQGLSQLPPPFTGCILACVELPPSKKVRAKRDKPYEALREAVWTYLKESNIKYSVTDIDELLLDLPTSWERHGDLIVLPEKSLRDPRWKKHIWKQTIMSNEPTSTSHTNHSHEQSVNNTHQMSNTSRVQQAQPQAGVDVESHECLWDVVASALKCRRLAIDQPVTCDSYRSSGALLLLGEDGWVEHVDNGVCYVFDVTKCMFSSGNISEKLRVAGLDCRGETIVDLYAGIGYFTLPYLVHTGATLVHACEWNPDAVESLQRGLVANKVKDRCIIHRGDNRKVAPEGVADRVNVGLVPSSEGGWPVACRALRNSTGGWLHIHGNVCSKPTREDSAQAEGGFVGAEYNPWEMSKSSPGEHTGLSSEDPARLLNDQPSTDAVEASCLDHGSAQSDSDGTPSKAPQGVTKQAIWQRWADYVAASILKLLRQGNPQDPAAGKDWSVTVGHLEHVKSYAPHVDHLVVDLECRPVTRVRQE